MDEERGRCRRISGELPCAATEPCITAEFLEAITVYETRMMRLLRCLCCPPRRQSLVVHIGAEASYTSRLDMNQGTLVNSCAVAGIPNSVIRNVPFHDEAASA